MDLLAGFTFAGARPISQPEWLVKGLLPVKGVAYLGGQSGAGKTFTLIDLGVSAALGEPFFGKKIPEPVATLILAAEGEGTLDARLQAATLVRAEGATLPIVWMGDVPNLADEGEVKKLIPKVKALAQHLRDTFGMRLGIIAIDTMAAAFALKDENDAAEAQRAIRIMRKLGDSVGALVLAVHHYGKGEETGLRGSSAYRAGSDAVLSVLADRNHVTGEVSNRSLALAKSRYGVEGPIAGFDLKFVPLGIDDDAEEFGACVIEPNLGAPPLATRHKAPVKDPAPIIALKAAFVEIGHAAQDVPVMGSGPFVRALTVEQIRPEFRRRYISGDTDPDKAAAAARQSLKRALEQAPKHGFHVAQWGGQEWIWQA
ncbi:hypothetical protein OPKNFCMD_5252 [Methylobacterium crusticola]|uniref:AAA family ATPase n=1 Tax=Methylobacterium crusticola TaxID=1697972 RepID=A0ABQ4R467_9HYPH|nr:hypothetical protein OPKNFCMD_5252 [Methylobacterium crusticola]